MKPAPQVAIALTVILLAACRSKEIHLYDAEGYGPNTAEISIKGDAGMAYWRWGEQTFAMKVTLVKDELIHSDREDGAKQETIHVAIYRGAASCEDCSDTARRSIEKLGSRYRVDFVGEHERVDISDESLAEYDIYVQPGGGQDIPKALKDIGSERARAIRNFVHHGGGYLGLCMGAYLADAGNLKLIDTYLDGESGRPGFPIYTSEDAAVVVHWRGREQSLYFQDGPYMQPAPGNARFRTIATYENGDIAAARYTYGDGRVVLVGPHPEADTSWFDDAGIPRSKMPHDDLVKDLMEEFDPLVSRRDGG
ncbi:hypothetical protein KCV01_g8993, partial [Aureobasidium melanogenum]